jgi:hypothetical protein
VANPTIATVEVTPIATMDTIIMCRVEKILEFICETREPNFCLGILIIKISVYLLPIRFRFGDPLNNI